MMGLGIGEFWRCLAISLSTLRVRTAVNDNEEEEQQQHDDENDKGAVHIIIHYSI